MPFEVAIVDPPEVPTYIRIAEKAEGPRYQLAHSLPGCVAECLLLLRSVDPCNADPVLHLSGVEDGDRVAIGNLDDGAFEDVGCGVGRRN